MIYYTIYLHQVLKCVSYSIYLICSVILTDASIIQLQSSMLMLSSLRAFDRLHYQ